MRPASSAAPERHPVPHLSDVLVYAYLQTARDGDAQQVVESLPNLKPFLVAQLSIDTALAAIPARFALDRGRWNEAAQLPVRDSQFPAAQSISYFARALGAARSGNIEAARAGIAHLDEIEAKLTAANDDYFRKTRGVADAPHSVATPSTRTWLRASSIGLLQHAP